MKRLACLAWLVAACGSAPDCKDVIARAGKQFGNEGAPEVTTLIGKCEQDRWPKELRECFGAATTRDALEACLPALDVKLPIPDVQPTAATKQLVPDGVTVLLFFSPNKDATGTAEVVDAYFKSLGKVAIEHHD